MRQIEAGNQLTTVNPLRTVRFKNYGYATVKIVISF